MLGIRKVNIADNERALLFRKNSFRRVLMPGTHWLVGATQIEVYDITEPAFEHRLARFLMANYGDALGAHLNAVDIGESEVGLVYRDGQLEDILAPGSFQLYWKAGAAIAVNVIDIRESIEVDAGLLRQIARGNRTLGVRLARVVKEAVVYVEVPDNHVGLLFVNGTLTRELAAGSYGFWQYDRNLVVKLLDKRLQTLEVSGQEILTKDRVSLRINLSAGYRIEDTHKVAVLLSDYREYLYRLFQLALREAVGTRTLDELLADKDALNDALAAACVAAAGEYGLGIVDVRAKDIILPGEMKDILNQVVEAEKSAEANLIKRREETQATRSLHNTAKVMEGNPVLMRLKELEVLEKVTERIDHITVYGGLEGVLKDLVKLPEALDQGRKG